MVCGFSPICSASHDLTEASEKALLPTRSCCSHVCDLVIDAPGFCKILAHQTFGDMLRWNPHFHAIVLEGGFDEQGTFVYIPLGHLQAMTELLRRRVVALLVAHKLLDRRFARNMLSWRHSGFSIDNSVRILDRGVQRSLAEYVSRPAISAQALEEDPL